ncbi:MAG: integrase core domain-containing protein [Ktedonobacteraceae bacterium]
MAENALLRQQLIILKRQVKRPACTHRDRIFLVLLARTVRAWKQALFLVQPETLLRWHREALSLFWKQKSKAHATQPRISPETIALIKEMAANNRLWGAERIRGELLKLGIQVCKRTVQKYMRSAHGSLPRGQKWRTFLHNHAQDVWACDALAGDGSLLSIPFCLLHHRTQDTASGSCRRYPSPTDAWVAQQLREATPYGQAPKYLMCDNDRKFGPGFARVATTSAIEILKTPYRAPQANATCERFMRSVRQECLNHLLILHEKQLQRVLNLYVSYFNQARPHQGIQQQIPELSGLSNTSHLAGDKVIAVPILGGLHHDYQKVA